MVEDEVDDLFKDAVQEPQLLESLAPAFGDVEWVTNNQYIYVNEVMHLAKIKLKCLKYNYDKAFS